MSVGEVKSVLILGVVLGEMTHVHKSNRYLHSLTVGLRKMYGLDVCS